jgi:hypothetical protein
MVCWNPLAIIHSSADMQCALSNHSSRSSGHSNYHWSMCKKGRTPRIQFGLCAGPVLPKRETEVISESDAFLFRTHSSTPDMKMSGIKIPCLLLIHASTHMLYPKKSILNAPNIWVGLVMLSRMTSPLRSSACGIRDR